MIRKLFLVLIIGVTLLSSQLSSAKEWDPQLLQASHLAYEGNYERADLLIDSYIQQHPEDPNGLFVKVAILDWKTALTGKSEQNSNQITLKIYKKANLLAVQKWYRDPDNIDYLIDLGNSYIFLARKYVDVGSWFDAALTGKKCQRHLEKALELDPSRVDGLLSLGGFHYFAAGSSDSTVLKKILGVRGTKEQGLAEIKRAAEEKNLFQYDAKYALMHIYADYDKNYEKALDILSSLENKFPDNSALRFKRPMIYEKQDPKKGANGYINFAKWCEKKKEKCDSHFLFEAYYKAAKLLKEKGELDKAKEYINRALLYDKKTNPQMASDALKLRNELGPLKDKNPK